MNPNEVAEAFRGMRAELDVLRAELEARRAISLKPKVPLPKFDWSAQDDWLVFRQKFDAMIESTGATDREARQLLLSGLIGRAAQATHGTDILKYGRSVQDVLTKLEKFFLRASNSQQFASALQGARQRPEENEQEFAVRALKMYRRAYPDLSKNTDHDYVLNFHFARGLRSEPLRKEAFKNQMKTFEQVMTIVGNEASAQHINKLITEQNDATLPEIEPMDIGNVRSNSDFDDVIEVAETLEEIGPDFADSINALERQLKRCYNCGSTEHLIARCPKPIFVTRQRRDRRSFGDDRENRWGSRDQSQRGVQIRQGGRWQNRKETDRFRPEPSRRYPGRDQQGRSIPRADSRFRNAGANSSRIHAVDALCEEDEDDIPEGVEDTVEGEVPLSKD